MLFKNEYKDRFLVEFIKPIEVRCMASLLVYYVHAIKYKIT